MNASLFMLGILLFLLPIVLFAQAPGPGLIPESGMIGNCSFITGEFTFDCIPLYLSYVLRFMFAFAGGFALTEIIRGGYEYALSGVQAVGIEKDFAKKRITHAIIGLSVVVLSYLIVDTLLSAFFAGT